MTELQSDRESAEIRQHHIVHLTKMEYRRFKLNRGTIESLASSSTVSFEQSKSGYSNRNTGVSSASPLAANYLSCTMAAHFSVQTTKIEDIVP